MVRHRSLLVAVLALALVAGACSSSSEESSDGAPSAASPSGALTRDDLTTASRSLDQQHGAVEGFSLVALALDQGYSVEQVVAGADQLAFAGWGVDVLPEPPGGSPQGVLEPPEDDGDPAGGLGPLGGAGDEEGSRGPATGELGEVRLASAAQLSTAEARDLRVRGLGMLLGELFRQSQEEYDARPRSTDDGAGGADQPAPADAGASDGTDDGQLTDRAVLEAILVLAARGYSLEQIVLALAEGNLGVEGLFSDCWYLPGEAPADPDQDQLAGECTPLDEIPAAAGGTGPGPAAPPPDEPAPVSIDGAYAGTLDRDVAIFDDMLGERGGTLTLNEAVVLVDGEVVERVTAEFVATGVRYSCPVTASFLLESDAEAPVVEGTAQLTGITRLTTTPCGDQDGIVGVEPVDIELVFTGEGIAMTFTFPAGTVRTATLTRFEDAG